MPCLLLKNGRLVKTVKFRNPTYVGDPVNAIRIYNEKEVDDLVVLDIGATPDGTPIDTALISRIASECFMPFAYGGGVRTLEQVGAILAIGVEKIVINSAAVDSPDFVTEVSTRFGAQSVVVSVDVGRRWLGGYEVYTHGGRRRARIDPVRFAVRAQELGAGEILLTSIDRDGSMKGYDIPLIRAVVDAVTIPVIACGGAGRVADFGAAVKEGGASAVAAGSMVVYQGPHRAVLINFPARPELERVLQ